MKIVETIIRNRYQITVLKFKVSELDKAKLSEKFLEHNFPDDYKVYVKCDENGNIEYRGDKQEYRTYKIDK